MNEKKRQLIAWALTLGMILLFVSALLPLFSFHWGALKYSFAAGALLVLVSRIFDKCPSADVTLRRLYRIQAASAFCYCISAFFLFFSGYSGGTDKDWLGFLTAGAVVQIYSAFRIEHVEAKMNKPGNNN